MSNVTVTFADLRRQAAQLRNGQRLIEDELARLRRQVAELVQTGYVTDRSSVAFDATYRAFDSGAAQTVGAIDGMARFLEHAADALESTDASLAASIG